MLVARIPSGKPRTDFYQEKYNIDFRMDTDVDYLSSYLRRFSPSDYGRSNNRNTNGASENTQSRELFSGDREIAMHSFLVAPIPLGEPSVYIYNVFVKHVIEHQVSTDIEYLIVYLKHLFNITSQYYCNPSTNISMMTEAVSLQHVEFQGHSIEFTHPVEHLNESTLSCQIDYQAMMSEGSNQKVTLVACIPSGEARTDLYRVLAKYNIDFRMDTDADYLGPYVRCVAPREHGNLIFYLKNLVSTVPAIAQTDNPATAWLKFPSNAFKRTVNTEERPYECKVCRKRFKSSSVFYIHKRIHTGVKPFECAVCQKRFMASCDLTKHMTRHTGEKPYECDVCHKKFTDRSSRLKHKKNIHNLR